MINVRVVGFSAQVYPTGKEFYTMVEFGIIFGFMLNPFNKEGEMIFL